MCILLPALLNKHAQVSGIKIIVNLFLPFMGRTICRNQLSRITDADEGSYYNAHISQLIFAAVDVATGVAN
jgi:hypothetical protein